MPQAGCAHCQRLSPVLDYLDQQSEKEEPDPSKRWFKLAKVDCDKSPRLKEVGVFRPMDGYPFVAALARRLLVARRSHAVVLCPEPSFSPLERKSKQKHFSGI